MKNPQITFPARPPELRLKRNPENTLGKLNALQASLLEEQRQLDSNQAAMRQREAHLRAEEARLRQWQSQLEANGAAETTDKTPKGNAARLDAAWTKLYRSREILEEEQRQLNSDRISLHNAALQLRDREAGLTAREARVAEAEQRIREFEESMNKKTSGLAGFTRAPFSFAKSVFHKT